MKKTFLIETLGCKVNQYESEAIRETLIGQGYAETKDGQVPDIAVFNTCCVTHLAERKSRQAIRKYTRMVPKPTIAVLGCYSQIAPGDIEKIEGVNIIMGTRDKAGLKSLLKRIESGEIFVFEDCPLIEDTYEDISLNEHEGKTRAFIKIQDGCDNFCSYCIIPYTRGRSRSRPFESIMKESMLLAERGYSEVVLIGIQSAFYGKDLESDIELVDLVEALSGIDGINRIRLGSCEPTYFTEDRLKRLVQIKKFCPHFHLSLQSGSDSVLKAMNRKYTREQYSKIMDDIRNIFDNPAVTTDLIVGFPGETDESFEETLSYIREMAFKDIHVFRYSKRKGTAAAGMPKHVNPSVAKSRSFAAIKCASECAKDFAQSQIGREEQVLFENICKEGIWEGHCMNFTKVRVESEEILSGQIRRVRLNCADADVIFGEIV